MARWLRWTLGLLALSFTLFALPARVEGPVLVARVRGRPWSRPASRFGLPGLFGWWAIGAALLTAGVVTTAACAAMR